MNQSEAGRPIPHRLARASIRSLWQRRGRPRRAAFLAGCAALVLGLARGQAGDADTALESFFKRHLEEQFRMRPAEATGLGDHRFDGQLEDISRESRARWLAHARQALQRLPREVDYSKLSRDGQIDFEIFRQALRRSIWLDENTHPFEEDPRTYNQYITDSVYTLLAQSTLPKETNISNALGRMARIPKAIDEAQRQLSHPPAPILETAIRQNRGAISFYEKEIFDLAGSTPQLEALRGAARPIVGRLQAYQTFLEGDLKQRATGQWRLGRKKFERKLELVLDAGMSASEVLGDAEAEFKRVREEMHAVARQLWHKYYPGKPLPPEDEAGRRTAIALVLEAVGKEHGRPEDLVRDGRATVDRIKTFIREKDILRLPDPDRCEIIEMPEFKRGNSVAYLESAPPLDKAAASFYAISPPPSDWDAAKVRSYLEEYNRHLLQVLTIHEAYPGHYVQLEYSNRSRSLIRKVLQSGVFIEGWAVYTERTMLDQGYGAGDPALRLSQLKFYLRAVANAMLDHRMHCGTMTDAEALAFLTEGAFQSEGEARLKIIRSKQSSVQLSTYFVGRMAHDRLRQQIQREMGEAFDLGRYHEAVLDHGSVPVKYLPELVRARLAKPR